MAKENVKEIEGEEIAKKTKGAAKKTTTKTTTAKATAKKTTTKKTADKAEKTTKTAAKKTTKSTAAKATTTKKTTKKEATVVERKKIMFVASESQPFVASGGLGEVIGSLPKALAKNPEYDIRVVMPLYSIIPEKFKSQFEYVGNMQVSLSWRSQYCGVFKFVYEGVTFYFLDNEYYFKRSGIYGYLDEAERFAFMSKAALDVIPLIGFIPQVIHCHDWQAALIPVYLKTTYKEREEYKHIRTVFTIHNMEYQGRYSIDLLYDLFELPSWAMSLVEYQEDINLMKGAIQCADIVSTVSPSYAKEILEPSASCGLNYINQQNSYKMRGILNGIDDISYDANTDEAIFKKFGVETLELKNENKMEMQKALGLPVNKDIPMIAMITRLVSHKGIDIVKDAMNDLVNKDIQFVVLGTGEFGYEEYFKGMERNYPDKVRALIEFNGALSRKIYASADMFLMPSKTEPCGLSQMIATRYATIPVVRRVGGLGDSIVDYGERNGIGFTFFDYNGYNLLASINRALEVYSDKEKWNELMVRAITTDFSWQASAKKYFVMYDELLNGNI